MMIENETPLTFNNEKGIISKKPLKKTFIMVTSFFVIIGIILALSFFSSELKNENKKTTIYYEVNKYRKISQLENSNYIKAIYQCPGNNNPCIFYDDITVNHTLLISSITADGENIPISRYHEFNESGTKTIIIKFKEKIKDMTRFFCESYLISVDFSNFDTSEMTNMKGLFFHCVNLESIVWGSNFSTSKVTDMSNLFEGCISLKTVDLSKFNTLKVTNFNNMFYKCISMTEINVSSFDTSNAISFSGMFTACHSLTSINLSHFKTRKVKYMDDMFFYCYDLKTINLDNFDTSNVITMYRMFSICNSLETLNLSSFNTSSLQNANEMFWNCDNLVSIEQHFTSERLISTEGMFENCRKLEKIDLSYFVGEVLADMTQMFFNCNSLTSIDLSNLVAEKCNDTTKIFKNLPDTGILLYNSLKINRNVLLTLPTKWTKNDVKS